MPPTHGSRLRLYAGLTFLSLVWGTQFLVIKVGQRSLPPLLTVALRFAIVALVSQAAVLVTGARSLSTEPHRWTRLGYGIAQALCMCLLYAAEAHMSSAVAGVLLATTPFFVALLAHLVLEGDRISGAKLAATTLGFAGIGVVMLGGVDDTPEAPTMAVLAVLAAALFGAVNKVLSKRLTHLLPAPVMLRDLGAIVAVAAALASLLLERDRAMSFSLEALAASLYLGLIASASASTLYLVLLRRFTVSSLAYLQFVTALVAVVTGVSIGAEALRTTTVLGAALVLAGLWVLGARERASSRSA